MNSKTPPMPRLSRAVLIIATVCLVTIFAGVIFVAAHADDPKSSTVIKTVLAATKARLTDLFVKLPLSFEINKGQTAAPVKFLSRGPGYQLFLTGNEAVLSTQKGSG